MNKRSSNRQFMKMSMPNITFLKNMTTRNISTRKPSRKSEKSLNRNKSTSQRSLTNNFRKINKSKNQSSGSKHGKTNRLLQNSKRKFQVGSNESSFNRLKDIDTSAISSMVYKIGTKNAKKVGSTSNNPLSPRNSNNFQRYLMSAERQSNIRKSSKLLKSYYGEAKNMKPIKSSRESLSSTARSNARGMSKSRKSLKHSLTRQYLTKSKGQGTKKKMNLSNLMNNRRMNNHRSRASNNLTCFKSSNTNKSTSSKRLKRQHSNRSSANISQTSQKSLKRKKPKIDNLQKKITAAIGEKSHVSTSSNVSPRNQPKGKLELKNQVCMNPKFKKYLEKRIQKKVLMKPKSPVISNIKKNSVAPTRNRANLNQYLSNLQSSRNDKRKSLVKSRESHLSNPQQPSGTPLQKPKFPMSSSQALKFYRKEMSEHEMGEILDFKTIYYLGQNSDKIQASVLKSPNYGYDDKNGDYKVVLNDHIAYRYQVVDSGNSSATILGKGSFGQALKCYDCKENKLVCLKIIKSEKRFFKQGLIEVKILKYLNEAGPDEMHNGVSMEESFLFRNHLCIVFELLSINLYEFLKKNNFSGVSLGLVKRFAVQLLMCLEFLEENKIIHCDLKPENIMLVKEDRSKLKVIDFGSGCFESERMYTYIQSRFYRSPEVILGIPYTTAIDMWSLGCILCELLIGYPIFPGQNEFEQMSRIMEILDVPPKEVLEISPRKEYFFDEKDKPILKPNSKGKTRYPNTLDLGEILGVEDPIFMDFLLGTLDWNPKTRVKPIDALQHEWIAQDFPPHLFIREN
ncbi:unnamed protein product [Moneuplotes crassus]|uniref:dual-specificity kinase n=2 Tax=Euplotes crassus TaxID=5936 RepID=A0AAD2DBE4_EUPCR|nr:unnamed protein product [Moneuplotes crassus]